MENKHNDDFPIVSIVIATFNSGRVLYRTLEAIAKQDYPRDRLDLMVVDGGSTDDTVSIAKKYGYRIIGNPKTDLVNAKLIGFKEAKGNFLVIVDHDEVMRNKCSISAKVSALKLHTYCKTAITSGVTRPKGTTGLNEYLSEYGDPFSLYLYHFTKGYGRFEKLLRKSYKITDETDEYFIVDFSDSKRQPIFELSCYSIMINRNFFIEHSDALNNPATLHHLFYVMVNQGFSKIVFMKNDPIDHYSLDSVKGYWPKLKWRIINNVHYPDRAEVGVTGRVKYQRGLFVKRYFFIPYAFTLIVPTIQGIFMAITRKNTAFLLHPVFSLYVAFQIVWQYFLKLIGKTPILMNYDGKKRIDE